MPSHLQDWYVPVGRVCTETIDHLTILVLYLHGSNAGQKCLEISRIFKFDVPL